MFSLQPGLYTGRNIATCGRVSDWTSAGGVLHRTHLYPDLQSGERSTATIHGRQRIHRQQRVFRRERKRWIERRKWVRRNGRRYVSANALQLFFRQSAVVDR